MYTTAANSPKTDAPEGFSIVAPGGVLSGGHFSRESLLTVALFCGIVFYGAFRVLEACLTNKSSVTEQEARVTKQMPKLHSLRNDLPIFAPAFEAFIIDHFPKRCEMTAIRNEILLKAFASSGHVDVGVGTHDWLYYLPIHVLHAQINSPSFSKLNLSLWVRAIEARQKFLADHGIKYLMMVVPEKAAVYPEYFAPGLKIKGGKSRLEQLQNALAEDKLVDFVDLKKGLVAHKSDKYALYQRHDAHWNLYGALLCARFMGEHIQRFYPEATFFNRADFPVTMEKSITGDLASALALSYQIPEMVPVVGLGDTETFAIAKKDVPYAGIYHEGSYAFTQDKKALPRVFMIHDSYVRYYMMPMIAELCRDVQFHWTQEFPTAKILEQKPDLFIEEMAERHLFDTDPPNVPELVEITRKTTFADATIGDGAGHPAIASFNDKVELVDAAINKTDDGYCAKLLWRADCNQELDKSIEVRIVDKDGKEICKKHYRQDILDRKVKTGDAWIDTIDLESKSLPAEARFAVVLIDPTSGLMPVQAKYSDWSSTRVLVDAVSLAKNWQSFEQNYSR